MASLMHCFRRSKDKRSAARVAPDVDLLFRSPPDQRGSEKALHDLNRDLGKLQRVLDREYTLRKECMVLKARRDQYSAPYRINVLTLKELEETRLLSKLEKAIKRAEKRHASAVKAATKQENVVGDGFVDYMRRFGLTPGLFALVELLVELSK